MKIEIPSNVRFILDELENNGFEAYIIGGCVRDSILGREPKDWDITTNATPDCVKSIFTNLGYTTVDTGIEFGTVSVVIDKICYEITTYRKDGTYSDCRRPSSNEFASSLKDDVQRRDFTINSLAYNKELMDLEDGLNDLQNGVVRAIGNPDERFKEDALRILRALRFSVKYNFTIENNTKEAMLRNAKLLDNISKERVSFEFLNIVRYADKLGEFLIDYYSIFEVILPELNLIKGVEQNNKYHRFTILGHTCVALNYYDNKDYYPDCSLYVKLALLFHDLGKSEVMMVGEDGYTHFYGHQDVSERITRDICERLKFTKEIRERVCLLVKYHDCNIPVTKKAIRRLYREIGEENTFLLMLVKECDILAHDVRLTFKMYEQVKQVFYMMSDIEYEDSCLKVSDLKISGNDFIQMGYKPSKSFGIVLNQLLDEVIDEKLTNNYQDLKTRALELFSQY